MNIFVEEHQNILKMLLAQKVDFMLIGGYAVIFHGYRRTTGDMDIWLNPTNENKDKLLLSLSELGFDDDDIAYLKTLDFEKHQVFSIGSEPEKIDFLTRVNQISFIEAKSNVVFADFENMKLPVIGMNDLVLSKINTGRKKDDADIEELQKLKRK